MYFSGPLKWHHYQKIALCEAQNWRCCYCKFSVDFIVGPTEMQSAATIEHVKPKKDGGTDDERNLVIACRLCNNVRGRANPYRFERSITTLLKRPEIRAAWHRLNKRHIFFLKNEIDFGARLEKASAGSPSAVASMRFILKKRRTLLKLVENEII